MRARRLPDSSFTLRIFMRSLILIVCVGVLAFVPGARAQTFNPNASPTSPTFTQPNANGPTFGPALPGEAGDGAPKTSLFLSALFAPNDPYPIRGCVHWRIFEERPQQEEAAKLVAETTESAPQLALSNGNYYAHAACGLAGATKFIRLNGPNVTEKIVLNAGGLKITGLLGETPAPAQKLGVAIYVPERGNSEAKLVLAKGRPSETIILPEGLYHIVSTLYDTSGGSAQNNAGAAVATNSVVTADLRVQAGKLTEASLRHRAAVMTLKLVNAAGGEALANTSFSILTPGGDVIRELIGAFPQLTLAEGEYVAIARHQGQTYQTVFKVQNNLDRDVEVLAQEGQTEQRHKIEPDPKSGFK